MGRVSAQTESSSVPEYVSWDELQQLPDEIADDIELWEHKVIWNRRGPFEHQQFSVRMRNAIESEARRAMRDGTREDEERCWQVGVETNVFFTADKSSFLTPDFLVRRCMPGGADTMVTDVVLVGEVLSGSDTPKRRAWKMDRYAEARIPWYWEVGLDSNGNWNIAEVRAYELVVIPTAGLPVKPLRPAVYIPVGAWEPNDSASIDISEPFDISISWDDLTL